MKIAFIDTETTGVNPDKNGLIQLSMYLYNYDEDRLLLVDKLNTNIAPFLADTIDDEALKINGLKREDLNNFPKPLDIYEGIKHTLLKYVDKFDKKDKFIFAGYNARFDSDFMRKFFEKCGDQYFGSYFWFPPLDIMNLAIWHLREERHFLKDFKLKTVCEYLVLVDGTENWHEAETDILMTVKLFKYFEGKIKC